MEDRRKAKKFLLAGAIIGGLTSLTISILMDTLFADSLQGTWRDAIANDLHNLLSIQLSPNNIIVYIVFILVLAILAAFGAFMGFIFSFFLYKFFSFLGSKE